MEFFKIAWRNLGRNIRRTIIIISAITLGIWGALVTMAIYNAFGVQMVNSFIYTDLGHIQIHAKGYQKNPSLRLCITDGQEVLQKLKHAGHLAGYTPRINAFALAQSARGAQGVYLTGIDPALEPTVTRIREFVKSGYFFESSDEPSVLVGKALAKGGVECADFRLN